jgi:hypothetical protein
VKCLTCKMCIIDFGDPGWSDHTPGTPGRWVCCADVWKITDEHDAKESIRSAFEKGETCDKWAPEGKENTQEDAQCS